MFRKKPREVKFKKPQKILLTSIFASYFSFFACAPTTNIPPSSTSSLEPTEALDQSTAQAPVELAERVIALTSLSADLTATLGEDKLIGISSSPMLAQDARFANIPTVSRSRTEPDLEKIVDLQPDLVIGAEGFHDKALQRLSDLDIPVLSVNIDSWKSLRSFTTTLASILDANAQPLLERYDACLTQPSAENLADSTSALVLVSRQPILAPNRNSWAGDFLAQLNIENLVAELQGDSEFSGYVTLSAEKVIEADPDTVMVVDTGEDLLGQLKAEPFWSELKATKDNNVLSFSYFGLINPGSVASIEATCEQLKSELTAK
ncbi:MAG: ABC transporter substrate-binding protein [Cyanobacteria bacterium P01_D01_bin.105]